MYKTHVTVKRKEQSNFFRRECNELLVICYLILGVAVPLKILVSSYCYLKFNENVTDYYKK